MEIIAHLLIMVTVVATILTIYGICLMDDDLAKKSAVVGGVCGILAITLLFTVCIKENEKEIEVSTSIQEEVQFQPENKYEPLSGCTTHVAAEICDQYQNEDGTYSNVFGVDYSKVQCFIWISEQPLPDDVPYLLTMDYIQRRIICLWKLLHLYLLSLLVLRLSLPFMVSALCIMT